MIEKVVLKNFISHADTEIVLEEGVNVFIGPNGAGKSSVIDAITYALFGEHTRNENRNLLRQGASNGAVAVTFSVDGRRFLAERRFTVGGKLESATLRDLSDKHLIVAGERKQFEESMKMEVEKILQMDYSRIKVAAIVQQGELNAIINCDPRELKELINKIIGLDKLDRAFSNAKDAIDLFRAKLRNNYGYDDNNLGAILSQIKELQKEKEGAKENLDRINLEYQELLKKEGEIKNRLKELEPLKEKVAKIETQRKNLFKYVEGKVNDWRQKIKEMDNIIKEGKKHLAIVQEKESFEEEKKKIIERENKLVEEERNLNSLLGSWKGQLEFAEKLEFKDNICPVCGSRVEKINDIFDKKEISKHIEELTKRLKEISSELKQIEKLKEELNTQEKNLIKSKVWLEDHSIQNTEQITRFEEEKNRIMERLNKIPANLSLANLQLMVFDDYSKSIVKEITSLEGEVKAFDEEEYNSLRKELEEKVQPRINEKIGERSRFEEKKNTAERKLKKLEEVYKEIEKASNFLKFCEKIRAEIFNRDGVLAMSLRSWALKEISSRASEYIRLFGLGISRISIEERRRGIDIECYGSRGLTEIKSMSGGEQVAIALALRFSMADLMGKGRIDFIILDEPTAHLDVERRKSLVELISNLNHRYMGTALKQIVIITHDEDIFANSEVNALFNFQKTDNITRVSKT